MIAPLPAAPRWRHGRLRIVEPRRQSRKSRSTPILPQDFDTQPIDPRPVHGKVDGADLTRPHRERKGGDRIAARRPNRARSAVQRRQLGRGGRPPLESRAITPRKASLLRPPRAPGLAMKRSTPLFAAAMSSVSRRVSALLFSEAE